MSSSQCYASVAGSIYSTPERLGVPCGTSDPAFYSADNGVQSCCVPGDTCGANSVCKWSTGDHPALGSGYYIGGCTDPTFQDPHCRPDCSRYGVGSDIVFVQGPGTWACCGKTNDGANMPNCSAVLEDQAYYLGWEPNDFPGPVDQPLVAALSTRVTSSSSSAVSTATTSSGQTTTSPAQSTTAQTTLAAPTSTATAAPSPLSTGAKAGIGIGAAVVALAFIGLLGFFALRWKRRRSSQQQAFANNGNKMEVEQRYQSVPSYQVDQSYQTGHQDKKPFSYNEFAGSQTSELNGERPRGELPA